MTGDVLYQNVGSLNSMNWKIKIIDKGYTDLRDIFIFRKNFEGKIEMLTSNGCVEVSEFGAFQAPTLQLDTEQLIAFATALNEQGINPQKEYVEGKLEATEKHLSDMRQLLKLK